MSLCTTEAIVLNRYLMGDSSLLVTMYTKDFGKLKVVAKGARRAKSKSASALEPFTHVSITFRRQEHRELQTLSGIEVVTIFRSLTEDLTKIAYAGAVTELINRLVIGEEPSRELFSLLGVTLTELHRNTPAACEVLFWGFELRFAMSFGYAPQFTRCAGCDHTLDGEEQARFSPVSGGVLCTRCLSQDPGAFAISLGTVKLLAQIQRLPLSMLPRFKPSKLSQREITHVIRSFFIYHTEDTRELKSLRFLNALEEDAATSGRLP